MKKLLCLLLVLMLPLLAAAESTPTDLPAATLTVTGSATVRLKADQAKLTLGVVHQADTVDEAAGENSKIVTAVFAALRTLGVAEKDMVTQDYAVTALYNYSHGKLTEQETVSGYEVMSLLRITVRDVSKLGTILDAVAKAGVNERCDIAFSSTASQDALDQALSLAIAEGVRKAQLTADAAGRTLGALVSITEQSGSYAGLSCAMDAEEADLPDGLHFSAEVIMVYELK